MAFPYHLLLFYFFPDRSAEILCCIRDSIGAGKMNRLDELENRSIYIIREFYSHFEKIAV